MNKGNLKRDPYQDPDIKITVYGNTATDVISASKIDPDQDNTTPIVPGA